MRKPRNAKPRNAKNLEMQKPRKNMCKNILQKICAIYIATKATDPVMRSGGVNA